jgi:hypothetical protein
MLLDVPKLIHPQSKQLVQISLNKKLLNYHDYSGSVEMLRLWELDEKDSSST